MTVKPAGGEEEVVGGEVQGWRHLHPLSPLLRGGLFILALIGIVVANLRQQLFDLFMRGNDFYAIYEQINEDEPIHVLTRAGMLVPVLLVLAGVLVVFFLVLWLMWRMRTFRILPDAVEERGGIIFRNYRRAAFNRVQGVTLRRSLIARVLGLATVEVVTAGGGGENSKFLLSYLKYAVAQQVRGQIMRGAGAARKKNSVGGFTQAGEQDATGCAVAPTEGAPAKPSGFVNDSSGHPAQATAGAAGQVLDLNARVNEFIDDDMDDYARERGTFVRVPISRLILSVLLSTELLIVYFLAVAVFIGLVISGPEVAAPIYLVVIVPTVLGVGAHVYSVLNHSFNFTISRSEDSVRIGAGLTQTASESIPLRRIFAIGATQPLLWRFFGWWKVQITIIGQSAASSGQNSLKNMVLPLGDVSEVCRVIEVVYPDSGLTPDDIAAALNGSGEGFLRPPKRAGVLLWFGLRRAGARIHTGDAGQSDTMLLRKGFVDKKLSLIPLSRVQSVGLSHPLAHRVLRLVTVKAHTVLGPVATGLRGLSREQGETFFSELAQALLVTPESKRLVRQPVSEDVE